MSQTPYACHNRAPFKDTLVVQDGWYMRDGADTRAPRMKTIQFKNERSCIYTTSDLGKVDPRCNGCSWASGLLQAAGEAVPS
jgi:hypothetical protein